MTININRLSREIIDVLATYTDEISDIVDKTCKEVAQNTAKELRRTSPKQSGDYAASWKVKKIKKGEYTVYNQKHYRLTHLLENGHAKRNGGRTRAFKHIEPAQEKAAEELIRKLADRL